MGDPVIITLFVIAWGFYMSSHLLVQHNLPFDYMKLLFKYLQKYLQ